MQLITLCIENVFLLGILDCCLADFLEVFPLTFHVGRLLGKELGPIDTSEAYCTNI